MFTGIVEEMGRVVETRPDGLTLRAEKVLAGTAIGDSICVNGVCLTVTTLDGDRFTVGVVPETLRRSNLGALQVGQGVNLERALTPQSRMGGHYVQGHVDGVGTIEAVVSEREALLIRIAAPEPIMRYVVEKGFICVDGISLTIVDRDDRSFRLTVIPFTQAATTLGRKGPGDPVNLEVDILAKYVEQLLAGRLVHTAP